MKNILVFFVTFLVLQGIGGVARDFTDSRFTGLVTALFIVTVIGVVAVLLGKDSPRGYGIPFSFGCIAAILLLAFGH